MHGLGRKTDEELQDSKEALVINTKQNTKVPLNQVKSKNIRTNQEGYIISLDQTSKIAQY